MTSRFSTGLISLGLSFAGALVPLLSHAPASAATSLSPISLHAAAPHQAEPVGTFVVVLRDAPLASYTGGIEGYDATAPAAGRRFNAHRSTMTPYRDRLLASQRRLLASIGNPDTIYSYTTVLNGFAAELTSLQLKELQSMPAVLVVEPERILALDSPAGRGRTLSGGSSPSAGPAGTTAALERAWRSVGGLASAGKGVVIGLVDSGIWPENPSFDGVPLDRVQRHTRFPGFTSRCKEGERWEAATCTEKVLGARYFLRGFGRSEVAAAEFLSPRDGSGHGSHTAATAGGNAGVDVAIQGQKFGHVSGVAPAAALAIYKACWIAPDPADDGCSSVDTLKAIDTAVSDGVDVLNYSINGDVAASSPPRTLDAIELAFYHAAAAGVFVATSAGDRGPDSATVAHNSPWVTTVAATALGGFEGGIRLGDGIRVKGSIVSAQQAGPLRLVDGASSAAAGYTEHQAALCSIGSLDAMQVKGAMVLCNRGIGSRLSKSLAVSQAGGSAMVLANDSAGHTYADVHAIPTLHVTRAGGNDVRRYIARDSAPTGTLLPTPDAVRPPVIVADFSSRGPAPDDGLLKPDLAAPGTGVLAAVAPPSNLGRLWDLYSGTSMAAPQVAGVAALLRSEHGDWSPAAIQSALMTTADRLSGRVSPLDQGAGALDPQEAIDPGLVYDAGRDEWSRYVQRLGVGHRPSRAALHSPGRRWDATDLNAASIAIGSLVGDRRVTRSVTNVSESTERFVAGHTGLRGIGVAVNPSAMTLRPGQSRSFEVSLSARSSARYGEYAAGTLTWTGSRGHIVESPTVVRPEHADAPLEVTGTSRGPVEITAQAGITGTVRASVSGPVGARPVRLQLDRAFFDPRLPLAASAAGIQSFDVPTETAAVRFEVASDATADDVDLHVYREGRLVAFASSSSSRERLTLLDPEPGDYAVYVNVPPASGEVKNAHFPRSPALVSQDPAQVTFTGWVLPGRVKPSVELEPRQIKVTGGRTFSVEIDTAALPISRRWFGLVRYDKSADVTHLTIN
ncbi:MAG: S8 family peptidase [Nocardioidaceae bacterium]|nr:S8 family peptidase [Nocardioidaceae bacterium]